MNSKVHPPFKVNTIMPEVGNPDIVEPIKKIAKLKYGRPREIVAADIEKRFKGAGISEERVEI